MNQYENAKKICVSEKTYMQVANELTFGMLKDFIHAILVNDDPEFLFIFCNREAKPKMLNWFWAEDFNYLGTRIKIMTDSSLTDLYVFADKNKANALGYIEILTK